MRNYITSPTMFADRFTERVVQPDESLVNQLHKLLDMIPNDNHALAIDHIVSELIRFHDPNRQHYADLLSPNTEKNDE